MQINHNIRAMITQHALYQNNNAMGKSLEKLSTGLRINRAQDDAAGLAMSEQMRSQIRGLGKAKQNAGDGICALQIAEGALAEITNMMQRQKELAVQAANDTLTSTERVYLDDEFQALTKEIDRIAKTTDYNGKNVLIFDQDPNLSFGATKLNPFNRNISFMEAAKELYGSFGAKLNGGLGTVGGDGVSTNNIDAKKMATDIAKRIYDSDVVDINDAQAAIAAIQKFKSDNSALLGYTPATDKLSDPGVPEITSKIISWTDSQGKAQSINLEAAPASLDFATNSITDLTNALNALYNTPPASGTLYVDFTTAQTAAYGTGTSPATATAGSYKDWTNARTDLADAEAGLNASMKELNDAILGVNKAIADLNGIPLSEGNIIDVLGNILKAGDKLVLDTTDASLAIQTLPFATQDPEVKFGGDLVYADVRNAFDADLIADGLRVEGSDKQAIQDFNMLLRNVRDAYEAYKAAEIGDPKYGNDGDILKGAAQSMADTLGRLFTSDNGDILTPGNGTAGDPFEFPQINEMATKAGNYNMFANATNEVIGRLNQLVKNGGYMVGGALSDEGVAALGGVFSRTASPQIRDAVETIMQFDVSKMTNSAGNTLPWDSADKQIALALQKTVGELSAAFGSYADELAYPVGAAASEILHISPNYSRSLGGKDASEIFVNYVAIDVKGLGMHAQSIDEQANATRAIDQVDDVIKVISGNRASIGTYINRLEYTINNIANMEYNTQDAESRIRDTDFSKETTEFTRNQIMVQSATSILAQANTLPQGVLALLG